MEAERIKQYDGLVSQLEEPIREIVPALWRLPFVVDTGYSCSGHVLAQSSSAYSKFLGQDGWYPHRAMLEIAYSLDPELEEVRDRFRADLKTVSVEQSAVQIRFDDVWTSKQEHLPYSRIPGPNLREDYSASVPELEKSWDSVNLVEKMLTGFWEEVAGVVRKYNPAAEIGPIRGSFRKVINWAHWRSCFPNRFSDGL